MSRLPDYLTDYTKKNLAFQAKTDDIKPVSGLSLSADVLFSIIIHYNTERKREKTYFAEEPELLKRKLSP